MKRWPLVLVALLISASTYAANATDPATKPAWRWTLDERLAARHDPVAAAVRLLELPAAQAAGRIKSTAAQIAPDQADFISGRKHPELLLPWEIFDYMMTS